ncbi:hypothetical protein I4U23_031363 [Adineta vaga]|nr:hypothetical protein I4U23_031363 [Adineta vaga]
MYQYNLLIERGEYDQHTSNQHRAMSIYQDSYPSLHIKIAYTLRHINRFLDVQEMYDKCLEFYHQTLIKAKKFFLFNHLDIICCLNNIGHVKEKTSSNPVQTK